MTTNPTAVAITIKGPPSSYASGSISSAVLELTGGTINSCDFPTDENDAVSNLVVKAHMKA